MIDATAPLDHVVYEILKRTNEVTDNRHSRNVRNQGSRLGPLVLAARRMSPFDPLRTWLTVNKVPTVDHSWEATIPL